MKRMLTAVVLALASVTAIPGCSLFTATATPSAQVLSEIRLAETAFLAAQTIINVRASDKGKPVSSDVKEAEALIYSYLLAAQDAATKGDTVTVNQKLDLFNAALAKFNEQYVAPATP